MRGADGIDAHVLHLADLAAHSSLVDSGTERAEVVVEASALELQLTAVEEEAFARLQLDGADTEGRGVAVDDSRAVGEGDGVLIEVGLVDVPELGSRDVEARAIDAVCSLAGEALRALSDDLTLGREDLRLDAQRATGEVAKASDLRLYGYVGLVSADRRRLDARAPERDVGGGGDGEVHVAVEPCARVPAAALVLVLQTDGERVACAGTNVWGDIEGKRVVAIGPVADLLAVDVDAGVAHRTIEAEEDTTITEVLGDVQAAAVPASPYEGKATGTTSMLHSFLLTILCDSQMLLVVLKAKGPVDRPVVGDGDTAPLAVIVVGGGEGSLVLAGEAPPLLEEELRALGL